MNRRAFLAGSFGVGAANLLVQAQLPPRTRIRGPYHTETYEHNDYEINFSLIQAGREIRYLAVRIASVSASYSYPQSVLEILMDAGLVEPDFGDFKPVGFTSNGAIFWILTLGQEQKLRIKGGYVYRLNNWLDRPPGESVDAMQIFAPTTLLITFGREAPTGLLL